LVFSLFAFLHLPPCLTVKRAGVPNRVPNSA
jgi:hypothetical protein